MKALVFAHYHPQGKIRADTLELLSKLSHLYAKIIFVSTCLNPVDADALPKKIEVLTRENYGYDFYSYRQGILQLRDIHGIWDTLTELTLINTSFLCVESEALINNFFEKDLNCNECLGITKSTAINEHIQSYLLRFGKNVLNDERVYNWWVRMIPLDDRQQVIHQYEIGVSQLILFLGYKLTATYKHWSFIPDELRKKFLYSDEEMLYKINLRFGALHYHWKDLFDEYGIIKIEVIKSNPEKVNLKPLNIAISGNQKLLNFVLEGLSN